MNEENKFTWECQNKECSALIANQGENEPSCNVCGSAKVKLISYPKCYDCTLEELFKEILSVIHYYLDVPEDTAILIALWIMASHFHKDFPTFPILYLNAMRGSGKTRTLNLVSHLSLGLKGHVENSISESALFHSEGSALCIDEFEPSATEKTRINLLLNSCYKRGAKVPRMIKIKKKGEESWRKEEHSLYMPVALANINGIDSVLENRALIVFLEKSFNPIITSRIEDYDKRLFTLRTKLLTISDKVTGMTAMTDILDKWNKFLDSEDKSPCHIIIPSDLSSCHCIYYLIWQAGISGRTLEICFPLLIMSALISADTFANALKIFSEVSKKRKESELDEAHVLLLRYISILPDDNKPYTTTELLNGLQLFSSIPISFNAISLSFALERLQLIKTKKRSANARVLILNVTKAKERINMFDKEATKD
ncbi:MAG: hypothetical protein Q8Q31_03780 [Nanoarchaeota archaeon]|nr:hypothetical protein [Nanoarchaeota archaeon]